MSLSQSSDEMKTAVFNFTELQSSTEALKLDAKEDREIHGVHLRVKEPVNNGGSVQVHSWLGTERTPPNGSAADNEDFEFWFGQGIINDDTNGTGGNGPGFASLTFNHPYQWSEDQTLTVEFNESQGDAKVGVVFVVHYREV